MGLSKFKMEAAAILCLVFYCKNRSRNATVRVRQTDARKTISLL